MDDKGSPTSDYLSIKEAAEYIGVSPQTLRRWDSAGKLKPVRHPSSGYRFYKKADLEPFRLEYLRGQKQVANGTDHLFQIMTVNIEENERLREPQREAHRAVRKHFETSSSPAILQIPVGCGKTGVIANLPFGLAKGRVLVITPNVTIRKGVSKALDIASLQCFWTRTRSLTSFLHGPYAAVLDGADANLHDCNESHFVVTNIQQLASSANRWLPQFPPGYFDLILVDEGHHNVAPSWRKAFERFPDAKVVSLTATPFRSDQKALEGEVIYRYSFARAMMQGYIKQIHAINFAPAEIYFTYRGESHHHTLEEVLELREDQWFRKGVSLAPECNRHIVDASIQHCNSLRERTGIKHQVIAAACSVDHARQVAALYQERGYSAREIYSEMDDQDKEDVIEDLKQGRIDCVVQVQMLGEGFDHPRLSVAAIFRPFRSLSPYVQFVGRIMRVIHEGEAGHPDNQGIVLSHVGLNNDEQWDDFREFDLDDQAIFHRWITGTDVIESPAGPGTPRRFNVGMQVEDEILSHFINQSFLNPDDDRVLESILDQKVGATGLSLKDLGVSKENLREKLIAQQKELEKQPKEIPVSPQRRRRTARKRLVERTNSVVRRMLGDLGFSTTGWEVGRAIASAGGQDNTAALTELLNKRVNQFLGIKSGQRNKISADQAEEAFSKLDELADELITKIEKAAN